MSLQLCRSYASNNLNVLALQNNNKLGFYIGLEF